MIRKFLPLAALVIALVAGTAHSQVYLLVSVYTNTLVSSSGGNSLLGVALTQDTTVEGTLYYVMDSQYAAQIQLTLSDGTTSINEDSGFNPTDVTQDPGNNTLTFSTLNTPWGGLYQEVIDLPPGVMRSDVPSTLVYLYAFFPKGGRTGTYVFCPSTVTISDATTTAVFEPVATPEPATLALAAIGGLACLFCSRRRFQNA